MSECECRKALTTALALLTDCLDALNQCAKDRGDETLSREHFLDSPEIVEISAALSAPCLCEGKQDVGLKPGGWFYAPCPNCGAIEGMGLSSQRSRTVAVYCPECKHFGETIEGLSNESDRAAVIAWNREFAGSFAERDSLRAELAASQERERLLREHVRLFLSGLAPTPSGNLACTWSDRDALSRASGDGHEA